MSKLKNKLKVFFTASFYGKERYQRYYDLISKKLGSDDIEVVGTETGNYMDILSKAEKEKATHLHQGFGGQGNKKVLHYFAIKKGILWSDAVIIEMSNQDFQLGHEATLAIQAKKPVLCLSIHEDFSEKIVDKYFHGAKYNDVTVGQIIKDFLDKAGKEKLSERFNCFLGKKHVAYLEKVAEEQEVSKSEYLRELIEKDMKK